MTADFSWRDPSGWCVPGPAEVDVWRASLDVSASLAARLARPLGPEERARAQRFRSGADQRRFTVARGVLRALIASYVGLPARALRLSEGIHGKPQLVPPTADAPHPELTFNVSHSGELALYAIARGRQVGIDLERMDATTDIEALARRFFSDAERSGFDSVEHERRTAAFYRVWTAKEAYLKARGLGLSLPLCSFDVALRSGEPTRLMAGGLTGRVESRWTLVELPAGPGYAAALAMEGTPRRVRLWRWNESTVRTLAIALAQRLSYSS
jgi:4'-phosphopantetheinyl transferase